MRSVLALIVLLSSCTGINQIKNPIKTRPVYFLNTHPKKILFLNTYNVAAEKYRDNKEQLFSRFIDSVLVTAAADVSDRINTETKVIRGVTFINQRNNTAIDSLMKSYNASHAIVVNAFNVSFVQTDVEVTKTNTGKEREAFYDIVSEIGFSFYEEGRLFKELVAAKRAQHSSRSVMSGLLAAGPNVVVQRKDAWKITKENIEGYLNLFFEGK